ncbi:MAG: hypothetical protein NDI94_02080 [Candidatus Woesearchaeota archaeon]|nr:hypothetical protein [Candidatus Woesearchaeota archaeon]
MGKNSITAKSILFALVLALIAPALSSLNLSSVNILPDNATTTTNLSCHFTVSGNTQVNVSWYNNSVLFRTTINSTSPDILSHTYTKKGQRWNCTVRAENSTDLLSETRSDRITIANSPPATPYVTNISGMNIGEYERITEGQNYTFALASTDADGDTLIYSKLSTQGDDYCTINSASGAIACSPTAESNTTINDAYDFLVRDGTNIVGMTLYLNVTPINDRPYFADLDNFTIYENETMTYNISVDDEETPNGPFSFDVNSSYNPERIENISSNGHDVTLRLTNNRKANYSDRGNYTITFIVCDPNNASLCYSDYFNLEVIPVNHDPVFLDIPNASGTEGQEFLLYINATDDDLDLLNFSVSAECGIDIWEIETIETSHNNASALINVTLNNTHIYCSNITIMVTDSKVTVSQDVFLNLTNINDAPYLNRYSHAQNSHNNRDILNLSAYTGVRFFYYLNGTDPDILTDADESLAYWDNSSSCGGLCPTLTLNATSGRISFLPNASFVGSYHYLIRVNDSSDASNTSRLNITVRNNYAPYFDQVPDDQTAYEDMIFEFKINATDIEDDFDTFTDNSSLFSISSAGMINFTPNCSFTGNYSIGIIINDSVGIINSTTFNLEILASPDTPQLPSVRNETILEELAYYANIGLDTADGDISCGQTDDLVFTSRFLNGQTLFNISGEGIISFTPNSTANGEYRINISVRDASNLTDSILWNLTIINRTTPPVIANITPHDRPMDTSWLERTLYYTYTNATENSTVYFAHQTYDPEGDPLLYNWTLDGDYITSSKNYTKYFSFNQNGSHDVILTVYDNVSGSIAHSVNFTWHILVHNYNRAPLLNSSLPDVSNITQQFRWNDYLSGGVGNIRFNDPDNDTLTYTNSPATKVTITYSGDDVIFTPVAIGTETIVFTASDGLGSKSSNNVTIEVLDVPETEGSSSSNSGSSSKSRSYTVIQEVEIQKDIFLDILNPEPATIYNNNTLRQIIQVINSGNKTLLGIKLAARTNSSTAKISFSNDYIPQLVPAESYKTDIIIEDYKIYNNYVIIVYANVSEPFYKEKSTLHINALEKSKGDSALSSTKITFARDLLSSNPECIELNEFLKRANYLIENGQHDEAIVVIDSVIQGCKYLVSQSRIEDDSPMEWLLKLNINDTPYLKEILIAFTVSMSVAIFLAIRSKITEREP